MATFFLASSFTGHKESVYSIDMNPDATIIISGSTEKVCVADLAYVEVVVIGYYLLLPAASCVGPSDL